MDDDDADDYVDWRRGDIDGSAPFHQRYGLSRGGRDGRVVLSKHFLLEEIGGTLPNRLQVLLAIDTTHYTLNTYCLLQVLIFTAVISQHERQMEW